MIFKPYDCASEKKIVELLLLNLPTNSIDRTLQIDNAIYHTSLYMKLEYCKEFTLVKSFTDHNQDWKNNSWIFLQAKQWQKTEKEKQ